MLEKAYIVVRSFTFICMASWQLWLMSPSLDIWLHCFRQCQTLGIPVSVRLAARCARPHASCPTSYTLSQLDVSNHAGGPLGLLVCQEWLGECQQEALDCVCNDMWGCACSSILGQHTVVPPIPNQGHSWGPTSKDAPQYATAMEPFTGACLASVSAQAILLGTRSQSSGGRTLQENI